MYLKHYLPSILAIGAAFVLMRMPVLAAALSIGALLIFGGAYALAVSQRIQSRLEEERERGRWTGPAFREVTTELAKKARLIDDR